MGRQVNLDADANYQCDRTVSAFTSQQRLPTVATSSCSYGRQIKFDEDSQFQCDQTVNAYETVNCTVALTVTISDVHELRKGQSCQTWAGYGDPNGSYSCPISNYGLPQTNAATSYLDQGYDRLYVNGNYLGTYTAWQKSNCYIKTTTAGRGGCSLTTTAGGGTIRGILTIWKDAGGYVTPGSDSCLPSPLNRVGYGVGMSLCKQECTSYTRRWVCGGPSQNQCNWAYVCASTGGSNSCPSGWNDLGESCRDSQYEQMQANGCALLSTQTNPLDTSGNDIINQFACPQTGNGCAALEMRAE
jgi:hypothetical protein